MTSEAQFGRNAPAQSTVDQLVRGQMKAPNLGRTHEHDQYALDDDFEDHSARHNENGADELLVESLGTASTSTAHAFVPDGSGGVTTKGLPIAVYKTSDQAVSSDDSLNDDADLRFAAEASSQYIISISVLLTSVDLADGGFKCAFSVPSGATGTHWGHLIGIASGAGGLIPISNYDVDTTITTALTFDCSGSTDTNVAATVNIRAHITTTNAGTIIFQHAQNTSNTNGYTLKEPSALVAHKYA